MQRRGKRKGRDTILENSLRYWWGEGRTPRGRGGRKRGNSRTQVSAYVSCPEREVAAVSVVWWGRVDAKLGSYVTRLENFTVLKNQISIDSEGRKGRHGEKKKEGGGPRSPAEGGFRLRGGISLRERGKW